MNVMTHSNRLDLLKICDGYQSAFAPVGVIFTSPPCKLAAFLWHLTVTARLLHDYHYVTSLDTQIGSVLIR